MTLNDWEGRLPKFLESTFNGDSDDISEFLVALELGERPIMEIGFGNNRFLRTLRTHMGAEKIPFFGLDKTRTFVNRAVKNFADDEFASFGILNIENIEMFAAALFNIDPEVVIFRYVLEHIPSWKRVLSTVSALSPKYVVVSLFIESDGDKTVSTTSNDYTVNKFVEKDLISFLYGYKLMEKRTYKPHPHTLRIFHRV